MEFNMNLRPLFIVGVGRCGTSMLLKLINEFTSIAIPAESHFIPKFARKLNRYGDLERRENLVKLLQDIKRFSYVKDWRMDFNLERIVERVDEYNYSGVIRAIYSEFAYQNGKQRWGDKTPPYLLHMSELLAMFPDAQFIHIIRDGRDCALSVIECTWGPKNVFRAANWWKDSLDSGLRQAKMMRDSRLEISSTYLQIRYEDILDDPETQLKKIFEFLEEKFDREIIAKCHIKRNNKLKWQEKMSKEDRKLFEQVAGDMLEELGYRREFNELTPISGLVSLAYLIDNRIKSTRNIWWDMKRAWHGTMVVNKK